MRRLQRHPGQFGNFARLRRTVHLHPPRLCLHAVAGLVHRPVLERAQRDGGIGAQLHAQFLVQLAGQRLQGRLAGFGLATGLDEAARTLLAHHQRPAAVIQDDRSHDPDRGCGVAHFRFCSNSLRMRLYWSSQESART